MKDKKGDHFFSFRRSHRYNISTDKKASNPESSQRFSLKISSPITNNGNSSGKTEVKTENDQNTQRKHSKSFSGSWMSRAILKSPLSSRKNIQSCPSTSKCVLDKSNIVNNACNVKQNVNRVSSSSVDVETTQSNSKSSTLHNTQTNLSTKPPPYKNLCPPRFEGFLCDTEEDEPSIMSTPKIIYAHKKTPELGVRSTKQIRQEFENMQRQGIFSSNNCSREHYSCSENCHEDFEQYECLLIDGNLNLSSLIGYRTPPERSNCFNNLQNHEHICEKEMEEKLKLYHKLNSNEKEINNSKSLTVVDQQICDLSNSDANSSTSTLTLGNTSTPNSSQLGIYEDTDSENETESKITTEAHGTESASFENKMEHNLENMKERNAKNTENEGAVHYRNPRSQLKIDVQSASSQKNTKLRSLHDEENSSTKSSSPRSPRIDIDNIFNERQKKIEESAKGNLNKVKDLTQRLQLTTNTDLRRDSATENHKTESQNSSNPLSVQVSPIKSSKETPKDFGSSLQWIKDELMKLKEQDENIAKQLVHLQVEMQRLRLHRSCNQHEALLEEVTSEEEELRAFMSSSDLIEWPKTQREDAFSPLRDFGVTRMNITNRRFSLR